LLSAKIEIIIRILKFFEGITCEYVCQYVFVAKASSVLDSNKVKVREPQNLE